METSWHRFLGSFRYDFSNIFSKNRKSVHIHLALAMDRFSSSGLKQKSFSPEWKEIYLLWIHEQDAIEFMSTIGCFHPCRLCPCCPVPGSLSAPQKPLSPWQPTLLCAPQSHCKGSPYIGAGFSSAPLPFSGTHTARKPSSLLDPSLQRLPDTLLHQSQAFHVWWATGHKRMEMRMTLARCSSTGMGWSSTLLHPEAGSISLVLWMCKSTACSHHVQAGRKQAKYIKGSAFSLDAKYSPLR